MKNHTAKGAITVLGIELAKQSFQLHGVNAEGEVVLKKKLNRNQPIQPIATNRVKPIANQ